MRTGWRDDAAAAVARGPRRRTTPSAGPRSPRRSPARRWSSRPAPRRSGPTTPTTRSGPGSDFVYLTGDHDPDSVLIMRPDGDGHDATLYIRPPLVPGHRRVLPQPRTASCGSGRRHDARPRRPTELGIETAPPGRPGARAGRLRARPHPGAARPRPGGRRGGAGLRPTATAAPATRELAAAPLRAQAGQGRVGDRPAAGRDRRDRPRLRGRRPGAAGRPARSPSGCSRASSGCAPGTTATTSATARSSAPARTRRSCTGCATTARPRPGELLLMDMGVEGRHLYTADVTRTLPVSGTFTPAAAAGLRHRVRVAAGRHRRDQARA